MKQKRKNTGNKVLWFNGLGQLFLVVGVYLTLIFKNITGLIILGLGLISILLYYLLKGKAILSDEMIDALSYKSNRFSLTAVLIAMVLLIITLVYIPISATNILLIIFSVFIISVIASNVYLFYNLGK